MGGVSTAPSCSTEKGKTPCFSWCDSVLEWRAVWSINSGQPQASQTHHHQVAEPALSATAQAQDLGLKWS